MILLDSAGNRAPKEESGEEYADVEQSEPELAKEPEEEIEKPKSKKSDDEWVSPPAGKCSAFTFKGKKYVRSSENEMWSQCADGSAGEWVGMFDTKTNKIDTSVADPYADEEDNE
jgi:hypothetical protein